MTAPTDGPLADSPPADTPLADGSWIGARLKRPDGPAKLTGSAPYAADLAPPGLLHVRLVLSPYARARIVGIDAAEALTIPGVVAVVTASDLAPYVKADPTSRARCLLAEGSHAPDVVSARSFARAVARGDTSGAAQDDRRVLAAGVASGPL